MQAVLFGSIEWIHFDWKYGQGAFSVEGVEGFRSNFFRQERFLVVLVCLIIGVDVLETCARPLEEGKQKD